MKRIRKQRLPQRAVAEPEKASEATEREERASDDTDDILAAIDEALEGLDQNLAKEYVQQGGE